MDKYLGLIWKVIYILKKFAVKLIPVGNGIQWNLSLLNK